MVCQSDMAVNLQKLQSSIKFAPQFTLVLPCQKPVCHIIGTWLLLHCTFFPFLAIVCDASLTTLLAFLGKSSISAQCDPRWLLFHNLHCAASRQLKSLPWEPAHLGTTTLAETVARIWTFVGWWVDGQLQQVGLNWLIQLGLLRKCHQNSTALGRNPEHCQISTMHDNLNKWNSKFFWPQLLCCAESVQQIVHCKMVPLSFLLQRPSIVRGSWQRLLVVVVVLWLGLQGVSFSSKTRVCSLHHHGQISLRPFKMDECETHAVLRQWICIDSRHCQLTTLFIELWSNARNCF